MTLIGTTADFAQTNPRWAGRMLGFSTWQTIGGYGCYVTAPANVFQAMGKDIDPQQVNELLKQKNLFVKDSYGQVSDVAAGALGKLYPDIKQVETKEWGEHAVAPIAYFDVRHTTKTEIIVKLDYHPEKAGIQSHYCRVIGINDAKNDVEIVDSMDGKRKWLSTIAAKGNRKALQIIWKAVKLQKV